MTFDAIISIFAPISISLLSLIVFCFVSYNSYFRHSKKNIQKEKSRGAQFRAKHPPPVKLQSH